MAVSWRPPDRQSTVHKVPFLTTIPLSLLLMEVFAAVSSRSDSGLSAADQQEAVEVALGRAVQELGETFPSHDMVPRRWSHPTGRMAIIYLTDQGVEDFAAPAPKSDGCLFLMGAHTAPREDVRRIRSGRDGVDLNGSGGTLTAISGGRNEISLASSLIPASPLFFSQSDKVRVLSNRGHIAAAACNPSKPLNPPAIHSLIQCGFLTGQATPLANVDALPLGARVQMSPKEIRIQDSTLSAGASSASAHRLLDDLAEALVEAVRPIGDMDRPVSLALSGGRDSRLIAAALYAANVPFEAVTRGAPDHPDAVIAGKVASALGVAHELVDSNDESSELMIWVEPPLERAVRVAQLTEATTSAWDDVSAPGPWIGSHVLSGIGGEVLRGGYAYTMSEVNTSTAEKKRSALFSGTTLLTDEARALADEEAETWRSRVAADAPGALDELYLRERLGRWGLARRAASTRNRFLGPFLDNRVIRQAMQIHPKERWTEKPVARLIQRLAPSLASIPLEGRSWRFDGMEPWIEKPVAGLIQRSSRLDRDDKAEVANGDSPPPDWRRLTDPDFRRLVEAAVTSDADPGGDALYQLVDRERLREAIDNGQVGSTRLWHLLTARAYFASHRAHVSSSNAKTVPVDLSGG